MSNAAATNATGAATAQAMTGAAWSTDDSSSTAGASASDAAAAGTRCILTQQPVTILALICRCLDAASLLSAYQSCRALKSAASHPLTFQHAIGVHVPRMRPVEILGPGATFSEPRKFALALHSPLMRHCRNLTLRTSSVPKLLGLLEVLHADAPALHSLSLLLGDACWRPHTTAAESEKLGQQLQLAGKSSWFSLWAPSETNVPAAEWALQDRTAAAGSDSASSSGASPAASSPHSSSVFLELLRDYPSSAAVLRLFDFASNPRLQYLRVLRLGCYAEFARSSPLLQQLPRSLELLQLQCEDAFMQYRVPADLPLWLRPLSKLRRLVLCGRVGSASSVGLPLASLQTLSQLCVECPQIERVDFLPPIDLASITSSLKEQNTNSSSSSSSTNAQSASQLLRLTSVKELRIVLLPILQPAESARLLHALTVFPSLTALTFNACVNPAVAHRHSLQSELVLSSWPAAIASQLRELRIQGVHNSKPLIDQLTAANMTALVTLELTQSRPSHNPPLVDLAPMLQSMPALQRLTFTGLRVESLDVLAHAPGLLSLSGLVWPYPDASSALKAHPLDQPPLCPVLQSLGVGFADEVYPLHCNPMPLLSRLFPALRSVQWRSLPAVAPSELPRLSSQHHFAHLFDSTFHRHPRHIRVGLLTRAETMLAQRKVTHPTEVPHKQMKSVLSVLEQEVEMQLFDAAKHEASTEMPFEIDLGPPLAADPHDSSHAASASYSSASSVAAASSAPPPVAFAFAVGGSGGKKRAGAKISAAAAPLHSFSPLSSAAVPLQPFAGAAGAPFAATANPFAGPACMGAASSAPSPFAAESSAGFASSFVPPSVSSSAGATFGFSSSAFPAFTPTPSDASQPMFAAAANAFAAASFSFTPAATTAAGAANPFVFAPPSSAPVASAESPPSSFAFASSAK